MLRLALALSALAAPALAGQVGQWQVDDTADRSMLGDTLTMVAKLRAQNEVRTWLSTERPVLVVRCKAEKKKRELDVYIIAGTPARTERSRWDGRAKRGARFDFRIDSAEPFDLRGSESQDGRSFFFPDKLLRRILETNAQRLAVRFTPFRAVPAEFAFDVSEAGKAVQPILDACEWK